MARLGRDQKLGQLDESQVVTDTSTAQIFLKKTETIRDNDPKDQHVAMSRLQYLLTCSSTYDPGTASSPHYIADDASMFSSCSNIDRTQYLTETVQCRFTTN